MKDLFRFSFFFSLSLSLFPITSSEHIRTLNRFLSVSSYTKNYAHSSAEPNCCCCCRCQSSKPAWIQFGKQQSAMKIGKNKAVNRSITARLRSTSFYWMGNLISVMTQRTREKRALTSLTTILFLQHPFNEAYQKHKHICFCFGYRAMLKEAHQNCLSLSLNLTQKSCT
jgi:hypothetical protein